MHADMRKNVKGRRIEGRGGGRGKGGEGADVELVNEAERRQGEVPQGHQQRHGREAALATAQAQNAALGLQRVHIDLGGDEGRDTRERDMVEKLLCVLPEVRRQGSPCTHRRAHKRQRGHVCGDRDLAEKKK